MRLALGAALCLALQLPASFADENVRKVLQIETPSVADDSEEAVPGRSLTKAQLPASLAEGEAFGTGGHPFTTAQVAGPGIAPVDSPPFNATGKLRMVLKGKGSVCTASVIGKSLLVTAAHCVHEFGKGDAGFVDAVTFQPARHGDQLPFGTWTAEELWIPKAYFDGSDVCTAKAPGIACENDLALIILKEQDGRGLGDIVGRYDVADEKFGYVSFGSRPSAQFTQLGYPSSNFDGTEMIRTDSLGYWEAPNNVIIGSNQTGGSSGGPWLQNFGNRTSHTGTAPTDGQLNTITAVTSWGYIGDKKKVQGASRFAKNTAYTEKSNIRSLIDELCATRPDAC